MIEKIQLVLPAKEHCQQVLDYKREFEINGDALNGSAGLARAVSFDEWLDNLSVNITRSGFVSASQYLAIRTVDNEIVGMINIRHTLNDYLLQFGGHIGYSVRRSERRKGYAKEMLRLALEKCRQLGLDSVLVTCDRDNIASARTIIANGGVLENEVVNEGRIMQRYWIECGSGHRKDVALAPAASKEYLEIQRQLRSLADERYAAFSRKLLPGSRHIHGVRLPLLHREARQICAKDWRSYLERGLTGNSFEESMLRGFIIAECECDWAEKAVLIQRFVNEIDNWSVCDSFCAALKTVKNKRDEALEWIRRYILSDSEFEVRFAAVMLLTHYLDDLYFNTALRLLACAGHEGYYAVTGVAWALSVAFFMRPEDVSLLLKTNNLQTVTAAKTREKIRQSKRFDRERHALLL